MRLEWVVDAGEVKAVCMNAQLTLQDNADEGESEIGSVMMSGVICC